VTNADNTVSVGSVGNTRRITNVAEGIDATDAVNVGQLQAVGTQVDTNTRGIAANTGRISANSARISGVENKVRYINVTAASAAIGQKAYAGAEKSIAMGNEATVEKGAQGSVAIGAYTKVNEGVQNAVAIGQYSVATEANTFSVGSDALKRRVVNVADGINDYDAVNMHQFNGLERKLSGVGAMNSAMSALVPNQRVASDTQLSIGLGYYDSETALAGGMFHYVNDEILLNAGVSYSRESGTAARAGVTWGF
jgi:autotransporter adhesin